MDSPQGDKTVRAGSGRSSHPNWAGQLRHLETPSCFRGCMRPICVSSATLDAAGRTTTSAEGCAITWQDAPVGSLRFQRQDNASAVRLSRPTVDLALENPRLRSRHHVESLRIENQRTKRPGAINCRSMAWKSAPMPQIDLAHGINLGFVRVGPIYDQGQKLLKAVHRQERHVFPSALARGAAQPACRADYNKRRRPEENGRSALLPRSNRSWTDWISCIADDELAIHVLAQPVSPRLPVEAIRRRT